MDMRPVSAHVEVTLSEIPVAVQNRFCFAKLIILNFLDISALYQV